MVDFSKYQAKIPTTSTTTSRDFSRYGEIVSPTVSTTIQPESDTNVLFPATPGEGPLQAGLKATGNVPGSAFRLGKDLFSAVTHPIQTLTGIGTLLESALEKAIPGEQVLEKRGIDPAGELGSFIKQRYGSLEALQKTATEDPFGFGLDVLGVITGGAGTVGKVRGVEQVISKVGGATTKAVGSTAKGIGQSALKTAEFGVSQATGLGKETIATIFRRGDEIKKAQALGTTRKTLGATVEEAINAKLDEFSDLGKGYDAIRQADGVVQLPEGFLAREFRKAGLEVQNGQIIPTRTAPTRQPADIGALQNLYNNWGDAMELTNAEFLNFRGDLAELAKFDRVSGKTKASETIAKSVRGELNKLGRPQIAGLDALDAQYTDDFKLLNQVKKDFLDKDGTLKDSAYSKIANLDKPNRTKMLARLEEVLPGIGDQVEIVRAIEDIERTSGLKVGTYFRGVVGGGALLTGNIPALIATILSQPEFAVPLIRGLGLATEQIQAVTNVVFRMMKDVNNLTVSGSALRQKIQEYIDNPKLGLSIEDVSKSGGVTDDLLQEARKYKTPEEFVKAHKPISQFTETGKEGKFWTTPEGADSGYGSVRKNAFIDLQNPKIYKGESSYDFVIKNGTIVEKNKVVKAFDNGDGMSEYKVAQDIAEKILKDKGYDGSWWTYEDDLNPTQYQIWDKSLLKTKSQLIDIWNKANKATPEASLIAEARKYKSAEEFVKAQGKTLYHGGSSNLDLSKPKPKGGALMIAADEGVYLAEGTPRGKAYAQIYADRHNFGQQKGKLFEFILDNDAKIFDVTQAGDRQALKNVLEETVKRLQKTKGYKEGYERFYSQELLQKLNNSRNKKQLDYVDSVRARTWAKIKKLGYDGMLLHEQGTSKTPLNSVHLWNTNKLQPKSQLIDIWNKANKK